MNPLDHDAVFTVGAHLLRLIGIIFCNGGKHFFIGHHLRMVFLIKLLHPIGDLTFLERAVSDRRQHAVPVHKAVFLHDSRLIFRLHNFAQVDRTCLTVGVELILALSDIFFLDFVFEPLVDLVFRLRTLDYRKPVTARSLGILRSQNFHAVAVLDFVIDRHKLSVDPRPDHLVADCSMDAVGKINGCRACRQGLDVAGRRKTVYAVGKQIQIAFQHVHEFFVIRHLALPFQNLTQPCQLFFFLCLNLFAVGGFFIFPVGGDTVFRHTMHFISSDLNLEGLPGASNQRRVQRLIHVCLGHRNIILETPRNRLVHLVDHAQRRITVLNRIYDNPDSKQVINLVDGLMLILHLFVNAEEMLDTTVNLSFDSRLFDVLGNLVHDSLNILFALAFAHRDLVHQIIINVRFEIF